MSCCGRQKKRKCQRQGKEMGASRWVWRKLGWRWSWKRGARGREVGKGDRPGSKCGRTCIKYRSRREARTGGTRGQRVP